MDRHIASLEPEPSVVLRAGESAYCFWLLETPLILETEEDAWNVHQIFSRFIEFVGGSLLDGYSAVVRLPGVMDARGDVMVNVEFPVFDRDRRYSLRELMSAWGFAITPDGADPFDF
jgi:hypothetical protein